MKDTIHNTQIEWLSSLRGALILFVFISHLSYMSLNRDFLFIVGRVGVVGFFIISGYLAYTALAKRNFSQYLLNRFLRIYPVYWILLTLTFLFKTYTLPVKDNFCEYLWNATLFEEIAGYGMMIGTSWMLSIMIVLYIVFAIQKSFSINSGLLFYTICLGTIFMSFIRFSTGVNLPTAFGLLTSVGIIGWIYKELDPQRKIIILWNILFFNMTLIISSILSYQDKALLYIISYNLAFVIFYFFKRLDLNIVLLTKLSNIGFTFFLCSGIPFKLCERYLYPDGDSNGIILTILQFVLSLCIADIITSYIEKPLLQWGKKAESYLG